MAYTALYRRYRPHCFGQLVGQPHIARVLASAVSRQSFVHAYLFCGPRGTGKTSAARILARAINCQQPAASGDPCGQCPACQREAAGESLDIIEIDGASNRGIDEIRDLRERVRYAPAQEKYKVYIIDEVHMLTNDAFNALLKTLEEPPAHVVFILATTAPHKLPLTVLSRCQRFDFRRIGEADISAHLLDIAQAEQILLSEDGAALIARKAEGGMRDAVSLLDQCAGACAFLDGAERPGENIVIDSAAVSTLLGAADRDFILELLRRLLSKDLPAVLEAVEVLSADGCDLRQALEDLLEAARDLLLQLLTPSGAKTQAGMALPEWAAAFAPAAYLALLQALADVDARMRYSLSPRITLELALIQACGVPEQASASPPAASVSAARPLPPAHARDLRPQRQPLTPSPAPPAASPKTAAKTVAKPTVEADFTYDPEQAPPFMDEDAPPLPDDELPPWEQDTAPAAPDELPPWEQEEDDRPLASAADEEPPWEEDTDSTPAVPPEAPPWEEEPPFGPDEQAAPPKPAAAKPAARVNKAAKQPPTKAPAADIGLIRSLWPQILSQIASKNPGAMAVMQDTRADHLEGSTLFIEFPALLSMFMSTVLGSGKNGYRPLVEGAIKEVSGVALTIDGFAGDDRPRPAAGEKPKEAEAFTPEPLPEEEDNLF